MPRHTGRTMAYVVCINGSIHFQIADGYREVLRKYPLRRRRYVFLPGVRYRSDGATVVNLARY